MRKRAPKKLSKKEAKAQKNKNLVNFSIQNNSFNEENQKTEKIVNVEKIQIEIPKVVTVRDFAEKMNKPVTSVIAELMKNGVMASINESIDFETAIIIGDELGFEILPQKESQVAKNELSEDEKKDLKPRPPIVVVMGHVDHGKTTLLDSIRSTHVADKESGGITQHIGAYQVEWKDKDKKEHLITFLDTPGHEAFSAMRAHGANITDIAILVVAADDGVKPQTKEAISHAKAANVPIIVAINKIDKPEADTERVKRELSDLDLLPEEWGGKTIMVPVSAKTGKNIDKLLDILLVVTEMEDLKANYKKSAEGIVIESHMQSGVGPVSTILVQNGILKTGQIIMAGNTFGKIRLMEDFKGNRITEAEPSKPVKIAGLHSVPNFGENVIVVPDERSARIQIASKSIKLNKFGLSEISEEAKKGKLKELNLVIKTDVQGSLEAIKNSLENLSEDNIKIKILYSGVGDISESDINMSISSKALIVGFRVKIIPAAKKLADEKGIKISLYDIIYNLVDDISLAIKGLIEPEFIEEITGKFEVIKVFYAGKNTRILGGKVTEGKIQSGLKAHLYQNGEKKGDIKVNTVKLEQNPVEEVTKGFECGVGIETDKNFKPGDILEFYKMIEILKKSK